MIVVSDDAEDAEKRRDEHHHLTPPAAEPRDLSGTGARIAGHQTYHSRTAFAAWIRLATISAIVRAQAWFDVPCVSPIRRDGFLMIIVTVNARAACVHRERAADAACGYIRLTSLV
jgi:hypothetical protein